RRPIAADEAAGGRRAVAPRDFAKREAGDAGSRVVADRRAEQRGRRAAKPAIAAEHQDLGGVLVHDRERIALAVPGCNHPAREFDHRVGHFLAGWKLVGGGHRLRGGILGAECFEAREGQRQCQRATGGPDRSVHAVADGWFPGTRIESWKDRWPPRATGSMVRTNRAAGGAAPPRAAGRGFPADPAAGWPAGRTGWRIR